MNECFKEEAYGLFQSFKSTHAQYHSFHIDYDESMIIEELSCEVGSLTTYLLNPVLCFLSIWFRSKILTVTYR